MTPGEIAAAFARTGRTQEYVPTGSLVLDLAMEGWPVGHVSEITGDPMAGKTTLLYCAAAEMQKLRQGPVMWIDFRGEFSPRKAEQAGVDTGSLLVMRGIPTRYGIGMGPCPFVVADGVSGWQDAEELLNTSSPNRTVVASSWRYRSMPGAYPWVQLAAHGGGVTEVSVSSPTTVGVAVATLRLCEHGIDRQAELLDLAEYAGLVEQRGSHWYYREEGSPTERHLGSGRERAAAALDYGNISQAVRAILTTRDSRVS